MSYKITCESCADLSPELYKKHKISVIPFQITMGDKDYKDGVNITNEDLFAFFENTKQLPKTSAINAFDYEEFFKQELKDCDGIIHISLSSQLSSTYEHAVEASKKFDNVYVIDSLSLSTGIGLQVLYATSLRDKDVPIKEAVTKIENRREHVQASFVVDKLNFLHKGGRCSALTLLGANVLSIRPSIEVKNGKMLVGKKYIGKIHKILDKYIYDTINQFSTPDKTMCFITYSSATEEMLNVARGTINNLKLFKKVYETTAGCTVSTHCGPNTLGILYYNDEGKK